MKYLKVIIPTIVVALLAFCIYIIWLAMDNDGDGLTNGAEISGWDIVVYHANGMTEKRHVSSDPGKVDSDGDGLTDYEEFLHVGMLDPSRKDTDGDGLDDYKEVVSSGTIPNKEDTDADGLPDGIEVNGWSILVEGKDIQVTSNPLLFNTDGDELNDYEEWNLKTDPSRKDTDDDSVTDGSDKNPVHNIKLKLTLLNFTLLSSPSGSGISIPYFYFVVSNCSLRTKKLPAMEEGTTFNFSQDFTYLLDVSDYKDYFPVKISLTAFDNNTQETFSTIYGTFKVDKALCINGSETIWNGLYDKYPDKQTFLISGEDGVLRFEIAIS